MPHVFGETTTLDRCWLAFLNPANVSVPQQRLLLKRGCGPVELLGKTVDFDATTMIEVCRQRVSAGINVDDSVAVPLAALANGIRLVPLSDPDYPPLLAQCGDAPPALFVRGDVQTLKGPNVAIVGARRASPLGLELSKRFARGLAQSGLTVASGLALGVDAAAHIGALEAARSTIAVLPCGIDKVYPKCHDGLAELIEDNGAVISEFYPGMPPRSAHFHRRNRTLSGLSHATLVIEAGQPSGSLITANAAIDQGREVFALPWSLGHPNGEGCLHLLAEGALLARHPDDIVGQLLPGYPLTKTFPERVDAKRHWSEEAALALSAIGDEGVSSDGVATRTGLQADACMRILAALELAGAVSREGGLWVRTSAY